MYSFYYCSFLLLSMLWYVLWFDEPSIPYIVITNIAITNKATVNIYVRVCMSICFEFSRICKVHKEDKCPGVQLLGHMIVACWVFFGFCGFFFNTKLFFQSSRANLKSHQQCMRGPVPQHLCQHSVLSPFFFF